MAHMINKMAYVGETPWHGLGSKLTAGESFEVWKREAGLDFHVERSAMTYMHKSQVREHPSREVLLRNDNGDSLGIVGKGYKIVQPEEVIHFFKDLADKGSFSLETAGSLQDGQRVWAMAKINDGFNVIGKDRVVPYLLMTTSFDGSTATVAKLTAIRVVCNNTLTLSLKNNEPSVVRVPHNSIWDAESAKVELGLIEESLSEYEEIAKRMAGCEMFAREADEILCDVLKGESAEDVRKSAAYSKIMDLFYNEKAIGAELTEGRTVWSFTNAVTEYYDHIAGRLQDTRIRSAWYGAGNAAKMKVWAKAAELVA